ncbi:SRPBCC domain-containing protein [Mucilaginibacter sp. BJC16-A38]|uniref:SRPBCC family protein n=1 Tax=Mucilaginibacter phenanthrenivorans TaxID=1234842 RepID=UPI0021573BFA|nr:SRPBCC domain-containing protein [Mucilaginibacter phenanthrenivorans]MCR8558001.1 SRPBCC domain-containing protein [Mucilaginibacter phenanthrenivorans]
MAKIIKHQFFFPHPQESVWEHLTKSELMAQWLMKNNFQPIVGHDFQFTTGPIPSLNFDGIFYCKVLEVDPFDRLSYSWSSGPGDGKITLDSVVTWTLEPKDKGTEVFLEHSGFAKKENLDFYNGLLQGWLEKFEKINKLLNAAQNAHTNA